MAPDEIPMVEAALAEKVRPLVNNILARFNDDNITPQEAGVVIIALMHRVLQILHDSPEAQRQIALSVLSLINEHLQGTLPDAADPPPCACS